MYNIVGGNHHKLSKNDFFDDNHNKIYPRESRNYIVYLLELKNRMLNDGYFQDEEHKTKGLINL